MAVPPMMSQITYVLPLGDLLALGKALYVADATTLTEKGLTAEESSAVQRVFDAIDEALEGSLGEGWLGDLEDEAAEEQVV